MRVIPLSLLIGLWPAAANAFDDPQLKALAPILAPEPGARICLHRRYDADHMGAHPRQKVIELTLLLLVRGLDKNGDVTASPDHIVYKSALSARRRGDRKPLVTSANCDGAEKARCAVECDGGGFDLEAAPEGVTLKLSGEGVAFGNDCDSRRGTFIAPGKDDKIFHLDPAPDAACAGLEKDMLGP
jgi:hypothetical protein